MSNVIKAGKQALTTAVVATTVLWSMGLASIVPASAATLMTGDLIKASGAAVYYYGSDGKRYVFPNQKTFMTWYANFSSVKTITDSELAAISIGGNVTYRPGTRLVKITTDPKVYAVEPGGKLRFIQSEQIAKDLYGNNWNQQIDDVSDAFFTNYTSGSVISTSLPSVGSLIKTASSSDIYYVDTLGKRKFADFNAFSANNFRSEFILTVSDAIANSVANGSAITGMETAISMFQTAAVVIPGPTLPAGNVTVSLDSTTPASTYVGAGTAFTTFTKVNFAAGATDVAVTGLTVTRTGLGSDNDINNVYLYDGDNRLALSTTLSQAKATFTNAAGLFTVKAGTTKSISIKADLSAGLTSNKTYAFGINAMTDVVASAGSTVAGTFPIMGNTMNSTTLSNPSLATLQAQAISVGTSLNAGTLNALVGQFQLQANNSNVKLSQVILTEVGSINAAQDLANIKIMNGATQVGATTLKPNADGTIVVDLSANPVVITSGQNVTWSVYADVLGTPNRSFTISIQRNYDITAWDTTYNAGILTTVVGGGSFPVQQAAAISVLAGNVVVTTNPNSPTGNVSTSINNVVLANFDVTASGEPVKLFTMPAQVQYTNAAACGTIEATADTLAGCDDMNFANLRLVDDQGVQLGTTYSTVSVAPAAAHTAGVNGKFTFTFGSSTSQLNYVIPANTKRTLSLKADILSTFRANVTAFRADLTAGTSNGQGTISLSNVSTSANQGRTLTIVTTPFVQGLSGALGNVTYVKGATAVRTGSFQLNAGAGEGISVSTITVLTNATAAATFQNLVLKVNGQPFGTLTQGSLANSTNYTFSGTPVIIPVGGTATVDVYEDIQSGAASATLAPAVSLVSAVGSGSTSGTARTATGGTIAGQSVTVAGSGTLVISGDSGSVAASNVAMGATGITFATFKLTTGTNEGVNITSIKVTDTQTGNNANAALSNIKLFDGQTLLGTQNSLSAGTVTFQFSPAYMISANTVKTLTIVADINAYNSTASFSGSTHTFGIAANGDIVGTGNGSGISITATGAGAATNGNAQTIYRTTLSAKMDGSSPSGSRTVSTTDQIAVFEFKAANNYDALLNQFAVAATSAATLGNNNVMRVRDANGYINNSVAGVAATSANGVLGAVISAFATPANDITAGDLMINGTSVGAVTGGGSAVAQATNLMTAINAQTGTTGVAAARIGTTAAGNKIALYRVGTPGDITILLGTTATLANTGLASGTTQVVPAFISAAPTGFTTPGDDITGGDLSICGLATPSATVFNCTGANVTSVGAVTGGTSATLQVDALVTAINAQTATTGVTAARLAATNTYVLVRTNSGFLGVVQSGTGTAARTGWTPVNTGTTPGSAGSVPSGTQSTVYIVALPLGYTISANTARLLTLEVDTATTSWNTTTNQDPGQLRVTNVAWNDQGGSSANIPAVSLPVSAGTLLY